MTKDRGIEEVAAPGAAPSERYPFWYQVDVRFKDIDIGGHAHHSHALVYIEEARAALWREVAGPGLDAVDYVMAGAELRFLRRIFYPDRLWVGVGVSRLSNKHFILDYEVRSSGGEVVVEAKTTQVGFDYESEKSARLKNVVKQKLSEYMIVQTP